MRMLGLVVLMLLENNRQLYLIARIAEVSKGLIAHNPIRPSSILLLGCPKSILQGRPSSILRIRHIDLNGYIAIIHLHGIGSIEYQLLPIRSD